MSKAILVQRNTLHGFSPSRILENARDTDGTKYVETYGLEATEKLVELCAYWKDLSVKENLGQILLEMFDWSICEDKKIEMLNGIVYEWNGEFWVESDE